MDQEAKEQLRQRLLTPTPTPLVRKLPGKRGDYVNWATNYARFKHDYPDASVEVMHTTLDEYGWTVVVRLTVDGILHDGVGFEARPERSIPSKDRDGNIYTPEARAEIVRKGLQQDSGVKAAASDALSRAMALAGYSLDLWLKDEDWQVVYPIIADGQSAPARGYRAAGSREDRGTYGHERSASTADGVWIESKYDDACAGCGKALHPGDRVLFDKTAPTGKKVKCATCGSNPAEPARAKDADEDAPPRTVTPPQGGGNGEHEVSSGKATSIAALWRTTALRKFPDLEHKSNDQLVTLIKETESALHERGATGFEDKETLRHQRTNYLGGPSIVHQEDVALRGYAAWLLHVRDGA